MADDPTPDRDTALLDELAELDLALARKVHAAAMAAEDPEQIADLARAYQRIARSARQTLALKARLARARAEAARATPPRPDYEGQRRRAGELREAMGRVIERFCEREEEREEREPLLDWLEEKVLGLDPLVDYSTVSLDHQVAQLCATFQLPGMLAARWRDLPPLVPEDEDNDEPLPGASYRSSA